MTVVTFGINHKTAPLLVRERLVFSDLDRQKALHDLLRHPAVNEAVLLSTCNRTEIYTNTTNPYVLQEWFCAQHAKTTDISAFCYWYEKEEAIKHLMRVGCGLDSMILGEPQIFGQLKQAFQLSCDLGYVGEALRPLFPAVFSACKEIRFKTAIGENAISFTYVALQIAKRIFSHLADCQVLLIGAGETIELAATHLRSQGIQKLIIANRSLEKAADLAKTFEATAIKIGDIPQYLSTTHIVITATASQLPILGKGLIERMTKQRKRQPLLLIDLAMPRDIEPEVAEIDDVYLYNLDDLQQIIARNLKNRSAAAEQAEALIEIQTEHYLRQLRVYEAGDMIHQYRSQLTDFCAIELQKAQKKIAQGVDSQIVLKEFSHILTQQFLHTPTIKLRQAAKEARLDLLLLAKELFNLP